MAATCCRPGAGLSGPVKLLRALTTGDAAADECALRDCVGVPALEPDRDGEDATEELGASLLRARCCC
jgi:uncharacterized protein (DUF2336 family)